MLLEKDRLIEAMGGLINELQNALGEKAFLIPSVQKAMAIIGRNALEEADNFRKDVEARELQEKKKH